MKNVLIRRLCGSACLISALTAVSVYGQAPAPAPPAPINPPFPLTRGEIKKITSWYFGNLVTSQTSSGTLGNFASLDPAGGSFKFQGTAFLGKDEAKADKAFISFLSFSAKGDLIGESAASLFSNSSLNTGISINASYHILIGIPKVTLDYAEYAFYEMSKNAAQKKYDRAAVIANEPLAVINERLTIVAKELAVTKASIDECLANRTKTAANFGGDQTKWQAMVDASKTNEDNLLKFEKLYTEFTLRQDSLNVALKFFPGANNYLAEYKKGKADDERQAVQDSLLIHFPLIKHAFHWITFAGGGGKQNYAVYDATAAFDNQISKPEFNTYNLGLSYNYFRKNTLNNRLTYFNVGFSRERTNNIELLATKAITDTKKNVNSAGDVTRVVEKKYNAYTDPIVEDEGWKLFLNSYFMYGKKPSGFHVFPEIHFLDSKTTIANVGIGYIVSFTNTKKDQPVINTEIYFKWKDLTDQGNSGITGVWNRNDIGISFTLPINFFNK